MPEPAIRRALGNDGAQWRRRFRCCCPIGVTATKTVPNNKLPYLFPIGVYFVVPVAVKRLALDADFPDLLFKELAPLLVLSSIDPGMDL